MKEEGVVRGMKRLLECLVGEEVGMRKLFPRMICIEFGDLEGGKEVGEVVKAMGVEVRRKLEWAVVHRRGGEIAGRAKRGRKRER